MNCQSDDGCPREGIFDTVEDGHLCLECCEAIWPKLRGKCDWCEADIEVNWRERDERSYCGNICAHADAVSARG